MWVDSTKPETLPSSALFKDGKCKEHVSMRETVDAEHKISTKKKKKKTETSIFLSLPTSKQGGAYKSTHDRASASQSTASRWKEVILPLSTGEATPVLGYPVLERHGRTGDSPERNPPR